MAGLVPAISMRIAGCLPKRDCRDKPGNDNGDGAAFRLSSRCHHSLLKSSEVEEQVIEAFYYHAKSPY
jgi:hypothetical protein